MVRRLIYSSDEAIESEYEKALADGRGTSKQGFSHKIWVAAEFYNLLIKKLQGTTAFYQKKEKRFNFQITRNLGTLDLTWGGKARTANSLADKFGRLTKASVLKIDLLPMQKRNTNRDVITLLTGQKKHQIKIEPLKNQLPF
ncbi:hypothetical protein EGR_07118 [Echinococcus granulosus]|uniref:Uncharacterized protein n=1 Tax=Echinococcus granulosus TaxID=6210 RepID=W6UIR3_ECHGR|nr:hypothetical protein EGR_07118 [Echinococcus granulosus]EUB58012.1 hypothetical protein EGR_07118 [Echinococcus granulosus]